MNQILYTIENEEEKNRINSIVSFFSVAIMIFGLVIVAMGGYQLVVAYREKQAAIEATQVPTIALEVEDNTVVVSVEHTKVISEIVYSWDDGEETTISENVSNTVTETIDIPAGTSTLNITVTDVDGKTSSTSEEFTYVGTYMDLSIVDNKILKVVLTDVEGLQSVTYRWNSDEASTAYLNGETEYEITSAIPVGLNTFTVTAINNENIVETKQQQVQGITRPTISMTFDSDRTTITIKLADTQGIASFSYSLSYAAIEDIVENGDIIENFEEKLTLYTSETVQVNGETTRTITLPYLEGFNYLEMTVTNVEGVEESASGWCAK